MHTIELNSDEHCTKLYGDSTIMGIMNDINLLKYSTWLVSTNDRNEKEIEVIRSNFCGDYVFNSCSSFFKSNLPHSG